MRSIKYYPLSAEEASKVVPNAYDSKAIEKQGLTKNYLEVRAAYMALLNEYLCDEVELDKYQEFLDENEYNFIAEEENVYSKAGAFGRKNIWIRNNAYVERLSKEDLAMLLAEMNDGSVNVTDELLEMVKRTMEEVISVKYEGNKGVFEAVYDMGVFQTNVAPSNALVITISYDFEYDEKGNILDDRKEDQKESIVEDLQKRMTEEIGEQLDLPVSVFY